MSYYDIDSILTDAQKLPCTFELEVPGLGILEGNAGEDIKAGTRIDLPLWLGEMLSIGARLGTSRLVTLDMPEALSERVMNALKADPRTLDLRALAPHFYNLSERILELFEEEEMVDVLGDAFKKRAADIADHAHNSRGAVGGGVDFLRGLDETERQLFRVAHDRAKDMRIWSGEAKQLHPNWETGGFLRHVNDAHSVNIMPAAIMDGKTQRRSSAAGQPAPSHSQGPVYHPKTAPKRIVSSKDHSSNLSERPQHPSLSRVKGRANMFTPPRMNAEVSWLRDQSPIHPGTKTPIRSSETPEPGTPTLVNPASALLQDLLKEERAHRSSRGTISDEFKENAPQTPETTRTQEDTASEKARKASDVFSVGQRKPKEMGMREMDQYVSKMNKLNFDLKLEVFHRTQQMAIYEKKLERMAEMEEQLAHMDELIAEVEELRTTEKDNQILRESNEQLRIDLDKRDMAVTEAVELICQLESKIDMLENGGRASRLSMSRPMTADGSEASATKSRAMVDIPERTSSKRNSSVLSVAQRQTSSELRKLSKAPSFLRADNKSTATLRSLYAPEEETQSRTAKTELTKSESFHTTTEVMEPESPRLSVLSECSELNPFDTPTRWQEFDQLEIPVRRSSSTGSLDSYVPPTGREESKKDQIDRWMQSREDVNQTIITRRRNRASSDATKASISSFTTDLYAPKPRGRGRLDASLFGGVRLPPTPDTMSTAYATGANRSNGSNGSITARKSPQTEQDLFFPDRRVNRPRSAEEMASRYSFDGSEVGDSMQTNCSDTPRLGVTGDESRTILPSFNTVSSKASALLGPGSPNNPAIETFDLHHANANEASTPTIKRVRSPTKAMTPEAHTNDRDSPSPLTPQDWVAAAKQAPRCCKPKPLEIRQGIQQTELPAHTAVRPASFHDDSSIASDPSEPEVPGIPTLDMTTLDILEQPLDFGQSKPKPETNPEPRRRLSFIPPFFNRSSNNSRRVQGSPVPNEFEDDDEEGAPSPVIPKTRTMGGASQRPTSQIITAPIDLYSSNPPIHNGEPPQAFRPRGFPQSLTMSTLADHPGSATVSGRPSTSHGIEHKRRSSLGIFGWMKGKRSDSVAVPGMEKSIDSAPKENRAPSRLAYETTHGLGIPRAETPDSMEAHVRPHSEMAVHSDEHARRPRYMGRRARRG
ncbi:hypothetical protein PENFLA_c016G02793 [Penicillium flavigenum]|uniref:DNA replication complex GINS protein PSF3 n=1 Tax=Penicillium flavigenum TaxID=254877 RepID=A0A1V6T354_9EURO|nr:hypothetical protein PENFLA_c016G02793 [Penicillium flavigenum]